jgi:anti-anti-sigma regulatory factor
VISLAARGELDLADRAALLSFHAALAADHERIVLGPLAFIDGAAAELIEKTRRELRARGGTLSLRHPKPYVGRTIGPCAGVSVPNGGRDLRGAHLPALRMATRR